MAKFSVGQYLAFIGDVNYAWYGIQQVTAVDDTNNNSWYEPTYTLTTVYQPTDSSIVGTVTTTYQSSVDPYCQVTSYPPSGSIQGVNVLGLGWLPMPPQMGPPLPIEWKVYWPWYKGAK